MKENKKTLISINLRLECFYLILFIVVYYLPKYSTFHEYNKNELIQFIVQFFIIILYIIEFYLSKKQNSDSKEDFKLTISQNYYFLVNSKKEKKKIFYKTFLLILSTLFFDCIAIYSSYKISIPFFQYFIDFISLFIIQTFLFKEKYYSHQYIVMIFHLLSIIILFYIKKEIRKLEIIFFLFIIINQYCFCFSILLCKKINTSYYTNIYLLGSIIGLSRFIFLSIYLNYYKKKEIKSLKFDNIYLYIYSIIRLIYYYLYYTFLMKFNPFIIILSQCTCLSIYEILSLIEINKYIKIVLSIPFLIPLLIFVEIIELNFCGLSDNLKYIIEERGKEEDEKMRPSNVSTELIAYF